MLASGRASVPRSPHSGGHAIHPIERSEDCLLDASDLHARGWTDALIRTHLPWPCARVDAAGAMLEDDDAREPGASGSPRWHVHRVALIERTEHFVHDYARSLIRRRVPRSRARGFRMVRTAMDRAFERHREAADGLGFLNLALRMLDHQQSIEPAAGIRIPSDAADRGASGE